MYKKQFSQINYLYETSRFQGLTKVPSQDNTFPGDVTQDEIVYLQDGT